MSVIAQAWRDAWAPRDRRPTHEWAADFVTIPDVLTKSGRFDCSSSRHFLGPLEALDDDRVREVNVCAPPRSGKTLIADLAICRRAGRESILFVLQKEDMAKSHAELRTMPMLRSVEAVRAMLPSDRDQIRNTEIIFNTGLPLIITGPSLSNLQNRGFQNVFIDEAWVIAAQHPGRMEEAKSRLGDFIREQSSKLGVISQAGTSGDEWHSQFLRGNLHEWEVPCAKCGVYFAPKFTGTRPDGTRWGLMWDSAKKESGKRDIDRALATLRFECPHCGHPHLDTTRTKDAWNRQGRYSADAGGNEKRKSFHWNNIIDFPWAELVEKWIAARDDYDNGVEISTIQFFQKQLAEFYEPEKGANIQRVPQSAVATGEAGKFWELQDFIFFTVDKQLDHYWGLVEAWSKNGESCVLWADQLATWEDVEAKQAEFNVPDSCVAIDAGNWQAEVWFWCAKHSTFNAASRTWSGWWAFKGSDASGFRFTKKGRDGKPEVVTLPYSWPPGIGDPGAGRHSDDPKLAEVRGKKCSTLFWSNPAIKDIAGSRRDLMQKGQRAIVAPGVSEHFQRHLFSERKTEVVTASRRFSRWAPIGRRPNHLWDCWCMSATLASMAEIIGAGK